MITFALEKRPDNTGTLVDTLVKYEEKDGQRTEEEWGTVHDFDRLFDACSRRWSTYGWDLEKLITCIRECEFD